MEKLSAFVSELQKELPAPHITEATVAEFADTTPQPTSDDEHALQIGRLEKRYTKDIQSLQGEIKLLKKDLARERRDHWKGMETIAALEQKWKEAHHRAQRLQLRLNRYERPQHKQVLLLPAHASPSTLPTGKDTSVVRDVKALVRFCDVCSNPIPETRRWNAKHCSERCERILLIKQKPNLMLHSPLLKEIGIEEGLWH